MDEDKKVVLSEQDIALLRAIARWRRDNGVNYFQWRPGKGFGAMTEWYLFTDRKRRTVSYEPGDVPEVAVVRDYYGGEGFTVLPTSTVTETVDVLVALGFLPARFSSAYRAGWDARARIESDARQRSVGEDSWDLSHFVEVWHSDAVPAVEAAW